MPDADMKLQAGDWVEVRDPIEIAETLDGDGTLDGLPFMPEMLPYCGQRCRVTRFALKTCMDLGNGVYRTHALRQKDIVLLEALRCSGEAHDGCQRLCMLFWKTEWLRKVDSGRLTAPPDESAVRALRARLKTMSEPGRYFCQSTQLSRITEPQQIQPRETLKQCLRDLRSGAVSVFQMVGLILLPWLRKTRARLFGPPQLLGPLTRTPVGTLGLQPGECVKVKSLDEVQATLDRHGRNRGLTCDAEMGRRFCGKQYRVLGRVDRMISESTGEMRKVEGTVFLEGTPCLCSWSIGGCPRQELCYWREAWLERVPLPAASQPR